MPHHVVLYQLAQQHGRLHILPNDVNNLVAQRGSRRCADVPGGYRQRLVTLLPAALAAQGGTHPLSPEQG